MGKYSPARLMKPVSVLIHKEQNWRIDVFALRKLIDSGLIKRTPFSTAGEKLADRLHAVLETQPEAAPAVLRQLRRIGRKEAVLETIERLWETKAEDSAPWALACARVWYDTATIWRGDIALSHAFELEPDWVELFKEQARNRRSRGNLAPSIDAAMRVLELDVSAAQDREWAELIGFQLFDAGEYARAITHLERLVAGSTEWSEWYRLAVSYEQVGQTDQAANAFESAARHADLREPQPLHRAVLHIRWGDMHAASAELEQLGVLPPEVENDRVQLLIQSSLQVEHLAVARAAASELRIDAGPYYAAAAALTHELLDEPKDAARAYDRALELVGPRGTVARQREMRLRRRLARALSNAGDLSRAVEAWCSIDSRYFDLRGMDDEVDPRFLSNIAAANAALAGNDLAGTVEILRRLSLSSSHFGNLEKVQWQLGNALAELGDTVAALRAFERGSNVLLATPREALDDAITPGRYELYAEAREVLPLDHNVVLYESFHGAKTGCNPLALCRGLLQTHPELRHVWAIVPGAPIHRDLLNDPRVTFVQFDSAGYWRLLATAGTLINNTSFARTFIRRDGQRYVNTWHGVPWKMLGRDIPGDPFAYDNIARNLLQATDLVFPDAHTTRVMLESQDVADISVARVHQLGYPRIDCTLTMSETLRSALRERLGVAAGKRIVFYAPTWRGTVGTIEGEVAPFVSAVKRMAAVADTHIVLRVHHFISTALEAQELPENISIVPEDVDTNEVFAIADVLVSDYSSVIFDFAPLNRPILKYVYDYDEYEASRGLYFPSRDVPGVDCRTETELVAALADVPERVDWSGLDTAYIWEGEDGRSTERVIQALFGAATPEIEPAVAPANNRVLISVVSLNPNGISRSLRNLLSAVPDLASRSRILIPKGALSNLGNREVAFEIHESVDFSLTTHRTVATRRENIAWNQLRTYRNAPSESALAQLRSLMQRERRRHLAHTQFSAVMDFDGYGLYQSALVGLGFQGTSRTSYVLHNEFEMERSVRFPALGATAQLLNTFDVLPSVSSSVMEANRDALAERFGVAAHLHVPMPNTINPELIAAQGNEALDSDLAEWMNQSGIHVVVAGRLSVEKNHEGFLRAMAKLHPDEGSMLRATFLGEGPKLGELRKLARNLGLEQRVFFAGYRANPYPTIRRADALVVSSTHEGQSLVLLEALTLGTAVVSTDIPGPASVLHGGELGVLVPPTVDGLVDGLRRIVTGELIPAEQFNADAYLRRAADALRFVVG